MQVPGQGCWHLRAQLLTQARELSCLHVRLEDMGDQTGKSPTSAAAPGPLGLFAHPLL